MEHVSLQHKIPGRLLMMICHFLFHMYEVMGHLAGKQVLLLAYLECLYCML